MTHDDAGPSVASAGSVADGSAERRRQSAADIHRLRALPFLEQLSDRGDAMKIVPLFALEIMDEAKDFIEGMLIENADLRAAIKHLGHNPVTFISRAKRKRERDDK